jgi:hypothetical protein
MLQWIDALFSWSGLIALLGLALSVVSRRRLIRWTGCAIILFVSLWTLTLWITELPLLLIQIVQEGVHLAGQVVTTVPDRVRNMLNTLSGQSQTPIPSPTTNLTGILLTTNLRIALISGIVFTIRLILEVIREKGVSIWHYLWDPS